MTVALMELSGAWKHEQGEVGSDSEWARSGRAFLSWHVSWNLRDQWSWNGRRKLSEDLESGDGGR